MAAEPTNPADPEFADDRTPDVAETLAVPETAAAPVAETAAPPATPSEPAAPAAPAAHVAPSAPQNPYAQAGAQPGPPAQPQNPYALPGQPAQPQNPYAQPGAQVPPPGYVPPQYAQQPYGQPGYPTDLPPSRLVAGLLGIFLGSIGVHRFYMGFTTIGVVQIILTFFTLGFAGIWGFIEGIMILARAESFRFDARGRPLRE